jgi:ABC-type sugar transport system permease subunit
MNRLKSFLRTAIVATPLLLVLGFALVPSTAVLADSPQQSACEGIGGKWDAPSSTCSNGKSLFGPNSFFQAVANTLIFLVAAVSVIMVIIGALRYVLSGGDSAGTKSAKDTIMYALIGLIVAALSYAAVQFVVTAVK